MKKYNYSYVCSNCNTEIIVEEFESCFNCDKKIKYPKLYCAGSDTIKLLHFCSKKCAMKCCLSNKNGLQEETVEMLCLSLGLERKLSEREMKEKYCESHTWRKCKGIKISNVYLEEGCDEYYVEDGFHEPCKEFWVNDEVSEMCVYTDLDKLVEEIEDCSEISFKDYKKKKIMGRKRKNDEVVKNENEKETYRP